jgi:hypothetical protein
VQSMLTCTGVATHRASGAAVADIPHVKSMREPEFIPSVFTEDQIRRLVTFSGRKFYERRLHLMILVPGSDSSQLV